MRGYRRHGYTWKLARTCAPAAAETKRVQRPPFLIVTVCLLRRCFSSVLVCSFRVFRVRSGNDWYSLAHEDATDDRLFEQIISLDRGEVPEGATLQDAAEADAEANAESATKA